jgi:hypothetical protein
MKKVSVLLFAVVSFILMISPAANAALVYDSGQLPIGKWHVHLSKHTFNADAAKNGVLSISRQAPGLAIHVGFVILNRRLIPLKRFLNGPDVTFQKKVRLKQRNRLRVFLIGSPGAAVGITIHTPAENQPPPTAALHAAPETIVAGAACTLTWSSEYADTCTIEPGIGRVDTGGSMTVSPAATTAYTLTASGSGGTVSSSVTVTVNPPVPTVTLSAVPTYITRGESAVLTWTTSNADACVITPSVGDVAPNGSVTVAPTETTAYAVTASGAGGTATDSMAIVVIQPVPTVDITVSPDSIHAGDSATLTWNSTHAESCVIEPDIGYAAPSGSVGVSPTETTTYTITATGFGGNSITESVTINVNPLNLSIISPVNAQVVRRNDVLVEGMVSNSSGKETGVVVNGFPAMVVEGRFIANHVALTDGENRITVAATDTEGHVAEETIVVYAEPTENHISLSADAESGIDMLETVLRVNGPLNYLTPSFTVTGPDAITFPDSYEENEYPVNMGQSGIYHFTAEVTDVQGYVYNDTIALVVMAAEEQDRLLKARWAGMRTALISGDIERALRFHHERYHEKYTDIYNALGSNLPTLAEQMPDISHICYNNGSAKYRVRQNHDINGQIRTITYYIYFSRGGNGLWSIEKY